MSVQNNVAMVSCFSPCRPHSTLTLTPNPFHLSLHSAPSSPEPSTHCTITCCAMQRTSLCTPHPALHHHLLHHAMHLTVRTAPRNAPTSRDHVTTICTTMHPTGSCQLPSIPMAHIASVPTCTHHQLNRWRNEATRSYHKHPVPVTPGRRKTSQSRDQSVRSHRSVSDSKRAKANNPNPSTDGQVSNTAADSRGLSGCAIYLGRNPHDVTQCDTQFLWDGHTTQKGDKGAKLRAARSGDTLCLDWNLPISCGSNSHLSSHCCSGCGSDDHEAQSCRLAQLRTQN